MQDYYFRKLTYHARHNSLLEEEIDVILSTISILLEDEHHPKRGSAFLDGQPSGEVARCIFSFNLEDGPIKTPSSDAYANQSINDILADRNSVFRCGIINGGGKPDEPPTKAICINASKGRFLFSFFADFKDGSEKRTDAILVAVARCLSLLAPEDKYLQESWRYIKGRYCQTKIINEFVTIVEGFFEDGTNPAIVAWHKMPEKRESFFE